MNGLMATLRMIIGLARGQTQDKQAEVAYRAAFEAGKFAAESSPWIDDEIAEFIIDNADDARQGLIDGLRGESNRYEPDPEFPADEPVAA